MSCRAIIIPVKGSPHVREIEDDDIHGILDGYLEMLSITPDAIAYVNEEGKLRGLPVNQRATKLLQEEIPIGLMPGDDIVGDVVIVGVYDEAGIHDGESHDAPFHLVDHLVDVTPEIQREIDKEQIPYLRFLQGKTINYVQVVDDTLNLMFMDLLCFTMRAVLKDISVDELRRKKIAGVLPYDGEKGLQFVFRDCSRAVFMGIDGSIDWAFTNTNGR